MKTIQTVSLALLVLVVGYAQASLDATAPASINVAYPTNGQTTVGIRDIVDLTLADPTTEYDSWSLYDDGYCATGGYTNPAAADAHIHVLNGQYGKMYLTFPQCTFAEESDDTSITTEIMAWVDLCGDVEQDTTLPRYMVQPGAAGTGFETVHITQTTEITFDNADGRVVVGPIPQSVWGDSGAGACDAISTETMTSTFHLCHKQSDSGSVTDTVSDVLNSASSASGFGSHWHCQTTTITMNLVDGLPSIGSVSSALTQHDTSDDDHTHDGTKTTLNKITFQPTDIGQYTCAASGYETKGGGTMHHIQSATTQRGAGADQGCRITTQIAIGTPALHSIWIDAAQNPELVALLTDAATTETYTLEVEHAEVTGVEDCDGNVVAHTAVDLDHSHFTTNADIAHSTDTATTHAGAAMAKNEFVIPLLFHDDDVSSMTSGLNPEDYCYIDIALYVKFTISDADNNNVPGARRLRVELPFKSSNGRQLTGVTKVEEGTISPPTRFGTSWTSATYQQDEKTVVTYHNEEKMTHFDIGVIVLGSLLLVLAAMGLAVYCKKSGWIGATHSSSYAPVLGESVALVIGK